LNLNARNQGAGCVCNLIGQFALSALREGARTKGKNHNRLQQARPNTIEGMYHCSSPGQIPTRSG